MTDTLEPMVAEPAAEQPVPAAPVWYRRRGVQTAGGVGLALVVAQVVLRGTTVFPANWYMTLGDRMRDFRSWIQRNRNSNFVIAHVLRPIGDAVLWLYEHVLDVLLDLPWFWLPLAFAVVIARSGKYVNAVAAAVALALIELAGFHQIGMETMSLMLICVGLCIIIGTPLGILAGLSPRAERILRPILDALQSLPTTLYLLFGLLLFGIRQTPAAVATIAFGVPPMIRIVAAGICDVPPASVEAGRIFGSSRWQLLWKVQFPQATRSFLTAVNQTVMMCLSMVVIGALIGAGGLGGELLQTLKLRSPGRGVVVGVAIFGIAFAFDRLGRSLIGARAVASRVRSRDYWLGAAAVLLVAYFVGRGIDHGQVPWTFARDVANPIDDLVKWIRDEFGRNLSSFSDWVTINLVLRLRNFLQVTVAWPVLIGAVTAAAWYLRGKLFAVFTFGGLVLIGLMGMWQPALLTLSQIVIAVVVGACIALPVGVFIGRRPRLEAVVEPFLDIMQTLPSFVYAIPFVMLFTVGFVPAMLSTMVFAIPAGVRLAALAVKGVQPEALEASTTFGATNRQRLWGVQIPLAMRGLVLAVNQLIMMSISMAIIAGMVGENGLGYKSVEGLTKPDVGVAVEAGLSLLVMAIVLDRLMEGLANRFDAAGQAPAR